MDYKIEFENILMGKLYYKNGYDYYPANEILYNHPLIQKLIKDSEELVELKKEIKSIIHLILNCPLDKQNIEELKAKANLYKRK